MIGLGAMGQRAEQNILDHGYSMILYGIRPDGMVPLVKKGAQIYIVELIGKHVGAWY